MSNFEFDSADIGRILFSFRKKDCGVCDYCNFKNRIGSKKEINKPTVVCVIRCRFGYKLLFDFYCEECFDEFYAKREKIIMISIDDKSERAFYEIVAKKSHYYVFPNLDFNKIQICDFCGDPTRIVVFLYNFKLKEAKIGFLCMDHFKEKYNSYFNNCEQCRSFFCDIRTIIKEYKKH